MKVGPKKFGTPPPPEMFGMCAPVDMTMKERLVASLMIYYV